jgi:hypothetical protein
LKMKRTYAPRLAPLTETSRRKTTFGRFPKTL